MGKIHERTVCVLRTAPLPEIIPYSFFGGIVPGGSRNGWGETSVTIQVF
jgi:hypothetical protein